MNSIPPLRTVHTATPAAGALPTVAARTSESALQNLTLPRLLRDVLQELLDLQLVESADIQRFLTQTADRTAQLVHRERIGQALVHAGVLTGYQRDRVMAGRTFGLRLGHYRVLDRLGGGSVGVVFLGEHVHLRRRVAIKVLPVDADVPPEIQERFHTEMRLLASLQHPHVVSAFDAGVLMSDSASQPSLHYLVLELVPGGDLENYVCDRGVVPVEQACEWIRQAAAGLQAAHDRHLIHRDLKPSNLLLTDTKQVKIVDFGLARQFASTLTQPSTLLGSVEFMSPEQSLDPTRVGPAADVYGLGASLFWILTGHLPLAQGHSMGEMVRQLQTGTPRRLHEFLPDAPEELDRFMHRMLARDPAARPTALDVMTVLASFTGRIDPAAHAPEDRRYDSEVIRLRQTVRQCEDRMRAKEADAGLAEEAVLFALAKMAESHDHETMGHLRRMQEYVRLLTACLANHAEWLVLQDGEYVAELLRCVPLHDIGKIGLPDDVLNKPGLLNFEERGIAETHPQRGCDILDALGEQHGRSLHFLSMARSVIRHHHERWDGTGYPDRLARTAIPPAARLVALADTYDALRRVRPQRPAMTHAVASATILDESGGQFDPSVVAAFRDCEKQFEDVFLTVPD